MPTLILLRHGESDWNQKNLFTGWVDVDLTEKGRTEAVRGGKLLVEEWRAARRGLHVAAARCAITTANLALDAADRHWIPVHRDWRLNERHYGALQDWTRPPPRRSTAKSSSWRGGAATTPAAADREAAASSARTPTRATRTSAAAR